MRADFKAVPVVDISGLYSTNPEDRKRVAEAINDASTNVGFLYIKGHKVSSEAIDGIKEAAKQFFAKPMEYKIKYYIGNSKCHRGYVPEGEEVFDDSPPDHKEAMDMGTHLPDDHPLVQLGLPMHGKNQWPDDLPGFRERAENYYNQIYALSKVLIHGFALALGEREDAFDQDFENQMTFFRLIHYPYNQGSGKRGIGEHTDYEFFTILLSDSPGLEVVNRSHEWIQVPPILGTFIVNISDMLETFTNGKFVATAHRVLEVPQERYSFPTFVSCNYNTIVAPSPQFVKDSNFTKKPVKAGDHLWASIIQTHRYLLERVESGKLQLPEGSTGL